MLIDLTPAHGPALAAFLADFAAAGEARIPAYFSDLDWPIERVVDAVSAWARGEQLGPGWVPCTTWFFEQGGDLLGVVNVRHHLTERLRHFGGHIGYSVRPSARGQGVATALLAATLPRVRAMGIQDVLLTCDPGNVASRRTIERNGGVLEDEALYAPEGKVVRTYWIRG